MYLFIFILLMTQFNEADSCRTSPRDPTIQELIQVTSTRFNVQSIKFRYITIDDEEIIENEFIYQNGNIRITTFYNITESHDKTSSQDTPKNLLEYISYKLNQRTQRDDVYPKAISSLSTYYCYQGKGATREISNYENGGVHIFNSAGDGEFLDARMDARIVLGYIGYLFSNTGSKYRVHVAEFLKKEGPYYLYEKDGFTILWHEIDFDEYLPEEERGNGETFSAEIWYNQNMDIYKIRQGIFFSRRYTLDRVKSVIGDNASCSYPELIQYDIYYNDIREFENGIHIPIHVTVDLWKEDYENDPRYEELIEQYKKVQNKREQDRIDFRIKRATFNKRVIKNYREFIVYDDSNLQINQPVPEETFIAPSPTVSRELNKSTLDQTSWFEKYKSYLFVSICILLTLIAMFLTRHYLGWGL